MISQTIHSDKAFKTHKWLEEELFDLLYPLEIHINTSKIIYNCDQEILKIIRQFWGYDITNLLKSKKYFQYTLKLIS